MKSSHLAIASLLLGLLLGAAPLLAEFNLWRGGARIEEIIEGHHEARRLLPPAPSQPRPRLVVDQLDYDFGLMQRGSSRTHAFLFTNQGEGPLELQIGKTSCKCTLSELAQNSIPPGESTQVTLEWKALTQGDEFRQQAVIHTNDPEQDRVLLTVSGKIIDLFSVRPHDLVFSNLQPKSKAKEAIRVTSYVEEEVEIVELRLSDPGTKEFFEIQQEPIPLEELDSPRAKKAWDIHVAIKPGLPVGMFLQTLSLVTDSPQIGTVEVLIHGRVSSHIRILGRGWSNKNQTLTLGTVRQEAGKQSTLTILVRGEYQKEANFKVAKVTPKQLTARIEKVEPLKDGNSTKISLRIEIPPGSAPGAFLERRHGRGGEVLIESNHPEAKSLRIPVHFAVIK